MQLWQDVDARTARLRTSRFSAVVDTAHPSAGLAEVCVDGVELAEFRPLAVHLAGDAGEPPPQAGAPAGGERYVRGSDLVATYTDRPAPNLRAQLYWRASHSERPDAIAAIELLASVQTSLLDSCPAVTVHSDLVACEAYQLVDAARGPFVRIVPPEVDGPAGEIALAHCYLFRLPGHHLSYAEMVHPADSRNSDWEGWLHGVDYRLRLQHELFAERLEKGVILRARVLGVLLDRHDDKISALRHWSAFLAEPLPLTT